MEIVNRTKVMNEAYERYEKSNMWNLWDAYGRFSKAKEDAWNYCKKLCAEYDGVGLKVIGANTFRFSAGFEFNKDNKVYFCYITDCSDRAMEIA